ncbi:hypothetical protein [Haloferax chudinovii]|uniref:Uncharacterized protein n=1 Tax=Haloferax chudinovii TaxID=1109010 RepID=A0ABD5XF95_9EURY
MTPAIKSLAGETEVEFHCGVAAETDECDHEPETIELDEPAYIDAEGMVYLPGRPLDCPECGNPHDFRFNGVGVMFR